VFPAQPPTTAAGKFGGFRIGTRAGVVTPIFYPGTNIQIHATWVGKNLGRRHR